MQTIHFHFQTIGSTNTWAKENAEQFQRQALTLVTADGQTGGRGRFNRRWESPAKQNLYATYCFFVDSNQKDAGNLSQLMGISAVQALNKLGVTPLLKWPNDVMLNGKKLGGILTEATLIEGMRCFFIGIGINVMMPKESLEIIDQPATSLIVETGRGQEISVVRNVLTETFKENLSVFIEKGFQPFFETYRSLISSKVGDRIRFSDQRHIWEGTFHEVSTDGSYVIRLPTGELKTFVAGELV